MYHHLSSDLERSEIYFVYESTSTMHCTVATLLIILAILISQSAGELVISPRNTESKVGDTTYFNCSTNLESREIFWNHGLRYIYTGETIFQPYNGRFEIDRNASKGSHNLVIHSVQPSDAGEYICIDDDGHGTRRSAELIVLDTDPDCQSNIRVDIDGVIGQNIFHIPLDEVQLTCNVTYHGNIPPQLEWMKDGDDIFIKDNITSIIKPNRLIYTLKLRGDISLDNSSYVCQTTRTTKNKSHKCTSKTFKVLYFIGGNTTQQNVGRGAEITCIADNNTFPCSSQWYQGNYTCPLSCAETLTTHVLGEYFCTLKCHARERDYYFVPLRVFVFEPTTTPLPTSAPTHPAAIAVPIATIVIILLVVLIVALIKLHRKKKDETRFARDMEERFNLFSGVDFTNALELKANVSKEEIELLHILKEDASQKENAIVSAVILNGNVFIVREKMSKIDVHDLDNFDYGQPLQVKNLISAYDMCACNVNHCLYIIDNKKITATEIMKLDTEGQFLKSWFTKDRALGNLSATREGNVILTAYNTKSLLEYSHVGELLRKINPLECKRPLHAIKVDNDRYIVSHGTFFDPLRGVSLVSAKGNTEASFPDKDESAEEQFRLPSYLAVGPNNCVIVADLIHSGLLLLDSNLKLITTIVPKCMQRFRKPRRIYLDDTLGLLVVVVAVGGTNRGNLWPQEQECVTSTENDAWMRCVEEGKKIAVHTSDKINEDTEKLDDSAKKGNRRKQDKSTEKIDEDSKKLDENAEKKDEDTDYRNKDVKIIDEYTEKMYTNPEELDRDSKKMDEDAKKTDECTQKKGDDTDNIDKGAKMIDKFIEKMNIDSNKLGNCSENMDEDTAEMDGVTKNIDKDSKKLYTDAEKMDEGTESMDEDTKKIDEGRENMDEDIEKMDKISIKLGTDSEKMGEDTDEMDDDTTNIDKNSKNLDKDTINVYENIEKMDEDTKEIDECTGEKDKNTKEIDEGTAELGKDINNIDEDAQRMLDDMENIDEESKLFDEDAGKISLDENTEKIPDKARKFTEIKKDVDGDCVLLVFDIKPLLQKYFGK